MESGYTGDYAIVGEGITDQIVIEAVLQGFHGDDAEIQVAYEQPQLDATGAHGPPAPGGWTLVVDYLRKRKYIEALQVNRYLVVHLDTDIAADLGVQLPTDGDVDASIDAIVSHLAGIIGNRAPIERFIFAIAVDKIECWLLPLVFDRSQPAKQKKQTGCLAAINHKRRQDDEEPLSNADESDKNPRVYRELARGFEKQAKLFDLVEGGNANPGLTHFIVGLALAPR